MNGCSKFDVKKDFKKGQLFDDEIGSLPIIMVDRGECTFVTKVRNIENLGIKMAIIADDKLENTESLIMADDSTGRSITIPSFMIRKLDADRIKSSLKSG